MSIKRDFSLFLLRLNRFQSNRKEAPDQEIRDQEITDDHLPFPEKGRVGVVEEETTRKSLSDSLPLLLLHHLSSPLSFLRLFSQASLLGCQADPCSSFSWWQFLGFPRSWQSMYSILSTLSTPFSILHSFLRPCFAIFNCLTHSQPCTVVDIARGDTYDLSVLSRKSGQVLTPRSFFLSPPLLPRLFSELLPFLGRTGRSQPQMNSTFTC